MGPIVGCVNGEAVSSPASFTAELIGESIPAWMAAADAVDAFAVALSLSTAPDGSVEHDLDRARLLLLAARPQEALTLLTSRQITDLPAEPMPTWPSLLLAACLAATGDHGAYRWLMAAVRQVPGAWQPLYLVGAAAEHQRDFVTADQAWTALVQSHGIVTRFTLARHLVSIVARRDQTDPRAAAQTMIDVVEAFRTHDLDLHEHPQPVLTAAAGLQRRGDETGSALLLHTASHRLPDVPALRAATQMITKRAEIRRFERREALRRWMHVPLMAPAAAVAVWCDLPPLVLCGLIPVLAVRRITVRAGIPGFTAADNAAWRAGHRLRQGPAARVPDTEQRIVGAVLAAIALTVAVPFAGVFAGTLLGRPAAIARTPLYVVAADVVFALTTVVLTALGLGLMAAARRYNWRTEQQARRQAERRRLADAGDCRCWRSSALVGSYAAAYLDRHLATAHPPRYAPDRVTEGSIARCLSTGTLWLATRTNPEDQLLLLRGADRASTDFSSPATGGYL